MEPFFHPYWFRWLVLPPTYTLAWIVLSRFFSIPSGYHRIVLTSGVGTCFLILMTACLGNLTHDLGYALWSTVGLSAALSITVFFRLPRRPSPSWKTKLDIPLALTIVAFLFLTVLVCRLALRFAFHDQLLIQAHPGVIESMLRGNFPPHLLIFPDVPLKYHWGSNLFGAVISYITGLPGIYAVDLVQIWGWTLLFWTIYVVARQAGLSRSFCLLAVLWVILGTGWAYLLKPWLTTPELLPKMNYDWPDSFLAFGRPFNPGTFNNFFMLPTSLGLPMVFATAYLLSSLTKDIKFLPLLVLGGFLGGFSLIHAPFFITALTATVIVLIIFSFIQKLSWKRATLCGTLLIGISLALACAVGGFTVRAPEYLTGSMAFNWPPGFLRNFSAMKRPMDIHAAQAFLWYLATFGSLVWLSIPTLALAYPALKKNCQVGALFLLTVSWLGFLVAQWFHYKLSWDIVKFLTLFHVGALFWVVFLLSQVPRRYFLWSIPLFAFFILDIIPSLRWANALSWKSASQVNPIQRNWWNVRFPYPTPAKQRLAAQLKAVPWRETVLAPYSISVTLAIMTGQSQAVTDTNTRYFGILPTLLRRNQDLWGKVTQNWDTAAMREASLRWIIFPCHEFEKTFSDTTRRALQNEVEKGSVRDLSFEEGGECYKVFQLQNPK